MRCDGGSVEPMPALSHLIAYCWIGLIVVSCGESGNSQPRNVILLVVDTHFTGRQEE